MNLEFTTIRHLDIDGVPHVLQAADVTKSVDFWKAWRSKETKEPLKKLIYINIEGTRYFACRVKALHSDTFQPINLTYQLKNRSNLLPYQITPVSYMIQALLNHGAAIDGSDTGLGKTYHALAVCREMKLKPLIICRMAGKAGWLRGCRIMEVEPYLICNWESMRTGKVKVDNTFPLLKKFKKIAGYESDEIEYQWRIPTGVILIFDEAHMGFNPNSLNYKMWTASTGITSLSLSATFADRPARMQALFKILRIMNEEEFHHWLISIDHFINQYDDLESLTSVDDMKIINKKLYPAYGYRKSYDDEDVKHFFPGRIILTEVVDIGSKFTNEQNQEYAKLLVKAQEYREAGKQAELMVADLRYRQHAELLKTQAIVEIVKEYIQDKKYIAVFVNFRETLKNLAELLQTRSMIFGDQERFGLSREKVIDDFQHGRSKIILCMSNAGGQSIDLHDLHGHGQRISLICPTYDPIILQQILGRTYRAKSKTTPVMKLIYAAGTVEEKVCDIVNRKIDNISALNNGDLMEPDLFKLGIEKVLL